LKGSRGEKRHKKKPRKHGGEIEVGKEGCVSWRIADLARQSREIRGEEDLT